jgi:hypothetical protein
MFSRLAQGESRWCEVSATISTADVAQELAARLNDCRRFAEICQSTAERANLPDRERLQEMAAAWLTVMRQLQRRGRAREI